MYKRLKEALEKSLSQDANLTRVVRKRSIPLEEIDVTILPDSFEFDGSRVVNGVFCKTVGEYKAELDKNNTDMGGWSG